MAYEPLSVALGNKVWNPLHLFLSWAVVYHDAKVLTPNIDVLIETSGKDVFPTWSDICRVPVKPIELRQWLDSRKGGILKLHGTIEHVHTVRIAINDIFVGLGHPLKRCFSEVLKSHHLLVLGYRGADEFDINPVLFRSRPKARILWVFHCESPGSDPEATERLFKRHEHLLSRLQRLNAEIAIAETQEFVRRLCLLSLQSDKDNMPSELVEWATSSVFPCCQTTPLTSSLWESQLQAWAAKISPEDRLHVWARILEYVGEYQKAMDVYQRCFETASGKPSLKRAETLFRLAWLRRRANPSLELLNLFEEAADEIEDVIERHLAAKPEALLLKGAILHQKGRLLQDRNDFESALESLVSAESLRQAINDYIGVAFTKFQRFMLGERAQRVLGESVNIIGSFSPEWQERLAPELEKASRALRRKGNLRDFTVMNHNIAFLYQFIAERIMIKSEAWEDALVLILKVTRKYHIVKRLRERLYEPRERAMTYARLAEAYKLKALILSKLGRKRSKSQACRCSFYWANRAIEIFGRLPDHERVLQVKSLLVDMANVRSGD